MKTDEKLPKKELSKRNEGEVATRKLARATKDKREVTIGPTTSTGPDITVQ